MLFFVSCEEQHEHTAPAIHARDSAAVMTSYGVNTLISDSGVAKYRIITEEWFSHIFSVIRLITMIR